MKESELLFDKHANKHMVEWNQNSFKKTHSKLHFSIISAIDELIKENLDLKNEILESGEY